MAKFLILGGAVAIFLGLVCLLGLILKRRGTGEPSPSLQALKEAGFQPSEAESLLCRQHLWQGNKVLLTAKEQRFFTALLSVVNRDRWLLCPQVRVADLATLSPRIKQRSRMWWKLFSMASQWHCDVVVIESGTFEIVAAIELDDASHLKKHRIRRDILLEEILKQSGIPLLRGWNSDKLVEKVSEFLTNRMEEKTAAPADVTETATGQTEHKESKK